MGTITCQHIEHNTHIVKNMFKILKLQYLYILITFFDNRSEYYPILSFLYSFMDNYSLSFDLFLTIMIS